MLRRIITDRELMVGDGQTRDASVGRRGDRREFRSRVEFLQKHWSVTQESVTLRDLEIRHGLQNPLQLAVAVIKRTAGRLLGGLKRADVRLNRKMLAQLAVSDPGSFTSVVGAAKG